MARKTVERNISYDDIRHLYYVSMDLGRDEMVSASSNTVPSPPWPRPETV